MHVPTKRAANKERVVLDRIEARGGVIRGLGIARSIEARRLDAIPIAVVADLQRAHAGANIRAPAGERIEFVFTEYPIQSMGDIPATDVAIPGPAEIKRPHLVVPQIAIRTVDIFAIRNRPENRRPGEEAVLIVVRAAVIEIRQE